MAKKKVAKVKEEKKVEKVINIGGHLKGQDEAKACVGDGCLVRGAQ